MEARNVFITGGTGFLGNAVALRLKRLGYKVTIQGRNQERCDAMRKQGFNVVQADSSNREAIQKACERQNVIINCAGIAAKFCQPSEYDQGNIAIVKLLIAECTKESRNPPKLIQISSPSVYCDLTNQVNIKESQ